MNVRSFSWPADRGMTALFLLAVALFTGCKSTDDSGPSGYASVVINGNTPGQIGEVAMAVFEENGFKVSGPGFTRLVFEKEGSKMSNIAYGNWISDDPVWTRVKATIVPVRTGVFRLQCQTFIVRDRGGTTEEEVRTRNRSSQTLLNEIASRLHQQKN